MSFISDDMKSTRRDVRTRIQARMDIAIPEGEMSDPML